MGYKRNGNYYAIEVNCLDGSTYDEDICTYFELDKIIKKIPENPERDELLIKFHALDSDKEVRVKLSELADKKTIISKLSTKNFFIELLKDNTFFQILSDKLKELIENCKYDYEHKCLGWQHINNKWLFLYDSKVIANNHVSTCIRKTGNFVSGSEAEYDKFLIKYVLNNKYMSLAYILGFTSVVNARISNLSDTGVMFVGISGVSTTGKTTALKLIASIYGDPSTKGTLIIKNATSEVGRENQIAGLFGIPILLDDVNVGFKGDISDYIYRIASGEARTVAKPDGDVDTSRMGFSGLAISTSELSLYEYSNKNSGIYARFIDLNGIHWTTDGTSAIEMKRITSKNYGFKGKKFGEFIETYDDNQLINIHEEVVEKIRSQLKITDNYTDRVLNQYGSIIATLRLVNLCFNLTINEDEIIDILVKNEVELVQKRNITQSSYEAVYEYYITNKSSFVNCSKREGYAWEKSYKGVAMYDGENNTRTLLIPIKTLKKILNELDYKQPEICIESWLNKGYLMHEKGRKDCSNQALGRHYKIVYHINDFDSKHQNPESKEVEDNDNNSN